MTGVQEPMRETKLIWLLDCGQQSETTMSSDRKGLQNW